jgi:hypothetical protein
MRISKVFVFHSGMSAMHVELRLRKMDIFQRDSPLRGCVQPLRFKQRLEDFA